MTETRQLHDFNQYADLWGACLIHQVFQFFCVIDNNFPILNVY